MVDSSRNRAPWDDRDGRDARDSRDGRTDWSDRPGRRTRPADDDWDGAPRRSYRRPDPGLEQRLDQWMTAGRQLVDGVAGARPGGRGQVRDAGARASSRLRPGDLGRWVENKLDWLLEDEDGWREPWQERSPQAAPARPLSTRPSAAGRRQPLEAISRRSAPLLTGAAPQPRQPLQSGPPPQAPPEAQEEWPDDASFSVNRWRREPAGGGPAAPVERQQQPAAARAVPRSSRRRRD